MDIRKLKAVDWREFWERFYCQECSALNWWYSGHSQKIAGNPEDYDLVIRCWSCKQLFLLRPFDEQIDDPDTDPVDGIRNPTESY